MISNTPTAYPGYASVVVLLFVLSLASCFGVETKERKVPPSESNTKGKALTGKPAIEDIANLLEASPAWSNILANDNQSQKIVIEYLERISQYDLAIIRVAIEQYINHKMATKSYGVSSMSRLYVLNRYLFDLPTDYPFDRSTFGGWIGVPEGNGRINLLWPFSYDSQGQLVLTGRFGGYNGHDYLATQEFDYFQQTFPTRK